MPVLPPDVPEELPRRRVGLHLAQAAQVAPPLVARRRGEVDVRHRLESGPPAPQMAVKSEPARTDRGPTCMMPAVEWMSTMG